jgi:hypothetical protein
VKQQGRYARLAEHRPNVAAALIGIPAAAVISAAVLGLGDWRRHGYTAAERRADAAALAVIPRRGQR